MDNTGKVLDQARRLFDLAGVVAAGPEGSAVLVLGLASTPERNLDESVVEGGKTVFRGWLEHVKPRVVALRDFLHGLGFEAEAVGWWGYPSPEVMQLKRLAVMAGLGQQGKNTLVIHSKYGPRLRLAAIRTSATMLPSPPGVYTWEGTPLCQSCRACIDACPVKKLLEPYRLLDPARCRANMSGQAASDKIEWCDLCLEACPVGK